MTFTKSRTFAVFGLLFAALLLSAPASAEECEEADAAGVPGIASNIGRRPLYVYAGQSNDRASWMAYDIANLTSVDYMDFGRVQTNIYALSGSAKPVKVRLSAFGYVGQLVFETDQCLSPGIPLCQRRLRHS